MHVVAGISAVICIISCVVNLTLASAYEVQEKYKDAVVNWHLAVSSILLLVMNLWIVYHV